MRLGEEMPKPEKERLTELSASHCTDFIEEKPFA